MTLDITLTELLLVSLALFLGSPPPHYFVPTKINDKLKKRETLAGQGHMCLFPVCGYQLAVCVSPHLSMGLYVVTQQTMTLDVLTSDML